ncbi:transforming growth factor, beta receptor associated protein 1 [Nowakowskiella sp. JEL0407]|nr:transforming growth factor, beta receptor associated protein 1 [Nowakowskiella sp. JEL0407]
MQPFALVALHALPAPTPPDENGPVSFLQRVNRSLPLAVDALDLCDSLLYAAVQDSLLVVPLSAPAPVPAKKSLSRKLLDKFLPIPDRNLLVLLSDATLCFFALDSLLPVNSLPAIRGVSSFSVSSNSSPLAFSFAKRRVLQSVILNENNALTLQSEIPLPDGAAVISRHRNYVCMADQDHYKMINIDTGTIVTLFSYDRIALRPLICYVDDDDFLLINAQQEMGLGIFVDCNGDATRGTILWSSVPRAIAFQYPYIAALLKNNTIEFHNKYTQQRVQILNLQPSLGVKTLTTATSEYVLPSDTSSTVKIIFSGKDTIYGIKMVSIDAQINELFKQIQIDRAVSLAESAFATPEKKPQLISTFQRAALFFFKETQFDDALLYFKKGKVDPRLLINLFPEYSTKKVEVAVEDTESPQSDETTPTAQQNDSTSTPSQSDEFDEFSWAKEFVSIDEMVASNLSRNYPDLDSETLQSFSSALIDNAKDVMIKYLQYIRKEQYFQDEQINTVVDTILLRTYVSQNSDPLLIDLMTTKNWCDLIASEKILLENQKYYPLSLLYQNHQMFEKGLEIWENIYSKTYTDETFPPLNSLYELTTTKITSRELYLKLATFILTHDTTLGTNCFVKRKLEFSDGSISETEVLRVLDRFGADCVMVYLEDLLGDGVANEGLYTRLIFMYIDNVVKVYDVDELTKLDAIFKQENLSKRQTYQTFLNNTASVTKQPQTVNKESQTTVKTATQHKHETALTILVQFLSDYAGAEEYCIKYCPTLNRSLANDNNNVRISTVGNNKSKGTVGSSSLTSGGVTSGEVNLVLYLVKLYLSFNSDEHAFEVLHLINCYSSILDLIEILEMIPPNWSLEMLNPFFKSKFQARNTTLHESKLLKSILWGDNLLVTHKLYNLMDATPSIVLSSIEKPGRGAQNLCRVCEKSIDIPEFKWMKDGSIAHLECG